MYPPSSVSARQPICFRMVAKAPERIASVIRSFERAGCTGFHSYNESWGDHLNVFLSSRLARDPGRDPGELVREYVAAMHGLAGSDLESVARVLEEMQELDAARAASTEPQRCR